MRKRYLAAVAGASLLALGGIGTAHAVPAYAYADIEITNFSLTGIFGTAGVTVTAQSVLISANADYPGFPAASSTVPGNVVVGGDVLQQTSGPGPFPGQNVFTQQLLASSGTRGDGLISGAIVGGASSSMVAEGRLNVAGAAGSSAGSNTTISATFTVVAGTLVNLSFDAIAHLFTSVGQLGDTATAQLSASAVITRSDGFVVFDASAGGGLAALNQTRSSQIPGVNGVYDFLGNPGPGPDFTFSVNLLPGTYTIVISDNVREQLTANVVPEPASLGILGLSLLALGMVTRRRRTS